MRHASTLIKAFASMAVLAIVSTLDPEHGILAAPSFLGTAPTPDAFLSGGGLLAIGFFSFTLAVAGARSRAPAAAFFSSFRVAKVSRSAR